MPKLKNKPPKYAKLKNYAVVYYHGKIHYLGLYGSDESRVAYARFVAESRVNPTFFLPKPSEGSGVAIRELAAAFLDHAQATLAPPNYNHYKIVVRDFLLKFYGDETLVDSFKPSSLKLLRSEMIQSRRFCRKMINDYMARTVRIFSWGVEEELVDANIPVALKAVKSLQPGHAGTFDNEEREHVPDEVIRRTLPFMPPTLAAMVQIQRLTGLRPGEVFNMTVGEIDRDTEPDLWLYRLKQHKTEKKTQRKKIVPLSKIEQDLLAPYLEGKTAEEAVFSPRTAMEERSAEKRANRKTKITPSQAARNAERALKPRQYKEFYNKDSYRVAVEYAINKGNKTLPEEEQIPHWTPYQMRHTAATVMEEKEGLDEAQALLDHSSANTTKRYAHGRLEKMKELARNRQNPFGSEASDVSG